MKSWSNLELALYPGPSWQRFGTSGIGMPWCEVQELKNRKTRLYNYLPSNPSFSTSLLIKSYLQLIQEISFVMKRKLLPSCRNILVWKRRRTTSISSLLSSAIHPSWMCRRIWRSEFKAGDKPKINWFSMYKSKILSVFSRSWKRFKRQLNFKQNYTAE